MNLYVDPEVQAQLRRMLHDINARPRSNGRRQLAPHERDPEIDRRMGVNLSASPGMRRGMMTPTEARAALASGPLDEGEHLVDRAMRMERYSGAPAAARGNPVTVDPHSGAVRMSHVPFGQRGGADWREALRRTNDQRGRRMADRFQPMREADVAREGFARINAAREAAR